MKKILFALSLTFLCFQNIKAQKETVQSISPNIESAVIYLYGAELTHNPDIKLSIGRNKILIKNISPQLVAQSVRINLPEEIEKEVSVLSISNNLDYLTKIEVRPKAKQIKDSIELITRKLQALTDEGDALLMEKELFKANLSIGSENNGVTAIELKNNMDLYRTRGIELNSKISTIEVQKAKISEILSRLQSEYAVIESGMIYQRNVVEVLLTAKKEMNIKIEIKYIVNEAGWAPSYDIKGMDVDKPVELIYRAKVFNNTGIDWSNLKITLSTGNPNKSAAKPELKPWFMDFYTGQNEGYIQNRSNGQRLNDNIILNNIAQQSMSPITDIGGDEGLSSITTTSMGFQDIEVSTLSTEFPIIEPYTIPSDNRPYLVDVVSYSLPANYKYFAVPKMEKEVFLIAQIRGWQELNLVEGPANVFFGGSYVGQSYISTRNVKDTLDLSFGRDPKVLITRTKLKDYSSTKFMGSKKKETYAFDITIKNNRKLPINIDVLDQVPISQNSEIEVEILEISKAEQNLTNGMLKWRFSIEAGKSESIKLSYSIKYPKTSFIQTEQKEVKYMRKF